MKRKALNVISVMAIVGLAGFLFTGGALADIIGSAHDFSGEDWNTSGEICITCHTPHNADSSDNVPLWDHTTTTSTFTAYSSGTLDAAVGTPEASSKACLSCHDGTIAIDAFGGAAGSTTIDGDALLGTDLSDDHPISFTYDTTLATNDGELADPATVSSGLGSTIASDMLISDKLECASCHDVHNTPGLASLLVKANDASALCLTCHEK